MGKRMWLAAAAWACGAALAAPPTEESVAALLVVSNMESIIESSYDGMEQLMASTTAEAAKGKTLSDEQRQALAGIPGKVVTLMREEMNWKRMQPIYVSIYRESFNQEEVDGLIAFYSSPAGQSLLTKMPVVMQKSMAVTQEIVQRMIPKLQATMQQAMDDAKVPR